MNCDIKNDKMIYESEYTDEIREEEEEEKHEEEEYIEIDPFPPDILNYANKIATLQDILMNIEPDNMVLIFLYLIENNYFESESLISNFISHILEVTDFRPAKIPLLCDFFSKLFFEIKGSPATIETIGNELLRQLFLSISNPYPFPNESSRPHFLYQLYKHQVIQIEKIIEKLNDFISNYNWFVEPIAWVVCYFIDLVPSTIIKKATSRVKNDRYSNIVFRNFFNEKIFNNIERKNINKYVEVLKNDDVDGLYSLLSPSFNYDLTIPQCIFEECWFIQREPTLICCAAYFGSIKCFKYLFLNGADLNKADQESRTVAQFAVAGGNIEMVRLAEFVGCNFEGTIQIAAHFFQNEIFEWLYSTKFNDLSQEEKLLHHAAYSGNVRILVHCVLNGCDVNGGYHPQTPILKAAENGKSDSVLILLSHPKTDPNRPCNNETPLIYAARNGRDECVKILCSSEKVDVNWDGNDGNALDYAIKYRQLDVVNVLNQFLDQNN